MRTSGMQTPARQAMMIFIVVMAAYTLSFFQRFAPASIAQDLALAFDTTAASLGVLAATYFYVYTLMQIPTGVLVDTLGPRRILLLGGIISFVGSLWFGLAADLSQALVGRTLVGLGVSVTFIAMLKIIALSFEEHRFASLTGLGVFVGNIGSVLAGVPLAFAATEIGWRSVFVVVAIASLVFGSMAWWMMRRSPTMGGTQVDRTVVLGGLWSVLRNRLTWAPALTNLGVSGSYFTFAGLWAMPYLTQVHGYTRNMAATHLSLMYGGFAIGCLVLGIISDRVRQRKSILLAASAVYSAIWCVWWWGGTLDITTTMALCFLMGFSAAGFSLTWACAKEVNPPQLAGMSTSIANVGGFFGAAVMQPLVGWLMDEVWAGTIVNGVRVYSLGDFRFGLSIVVVMALFGLIAGCFIRETRCKNLWVAAQKLD
ncbi:MAG: MFS transporter [Rhodocyclaceae bacterium]|nr:MFS transporter [Rhodocyclaceae bacterium]